MYLLNLKVQFSINWKWQEVCDHVMKPEDKFLFNISFRLAQTSILVIYLHVTTARENFLYDCATSCCLYLDTFHPLQWSLYLITFSELAYDFPRAYFMICLHVSIFTSQLTIASELFLQEEILDETDEYVDVHNKYVKVCNSLFFSFIVCLRGFIGLLLLQDQDKHVTYKKVITKILWKCIYLSVSTSNSNGIATVSPSRCFCITFTCFSV